MDGALAPLRSLPPSGTAGVVVTHATTPARPSSPREPRVVALVLPAVGPEDGSYPWRLGWPAAALQRRGYPFAVRERWPTEAGMWLLRATERPAQARQFAGVYGPPEGQLRDDLDAGLPDAVLLPRLYWLKMNGPARGLAERGVAWFCAELRRLGVALLHDFDDDLFSPEAMPELREVQADQPFPTRPVSMGAWAAGTTAYYGAFLRRADGVTVSTPALRDVVRRHAPPGLPVAVVPNMIDPAPYRRAHQLAQLEGTHGRPPPLRGRVVVGWAGTARSAHHFTGTGLADAWARLARRFPHTVAFVVAGHAPPALLAAVPPERVLRVPYVEVAAWPATLALMDVACCPLAAGEPFAATKSPQAVWERALVGAATVASPTVYGADPGYAAAGGLLAEGADAWEDHLSRLVASRPERRERAEGVAAWAVREHGAEAQAHRWPAAWRELLDARGHTG